ncbi:hypothetical protein PoB_003892500 [Plakobranchus ocellatus]|uniref:Uncharacterized protein n=1 Tax=Plakobranchus ocellatus TaxID=259542 RepID=A0AAV4B024_9GAST|nr:hypothetical protein PoB_003892500 [Plakobranchus ocellatus]
MQCSSRVIESGRALKIERQPTNSSISRRCSVDSPSTSFRSFTLSLLPQQPSSDKTFQPQSSWLLPSSSFPTTTRLAAGTEPSPVVFHHK